MQYSNITANDHCHNLILLSLYNVQRTVTTRPWYRWITILLARFVTTTCFSPWLEKCPRASSSRASWTAATLERCLICPIRLWQTVHTRKWRLRLSMTLVQCFHSRSNWLVITPMMLRKQWLNAADAISCKTRCKAIC